MEKYFQTSIISKKKFTLTNWFCLFLIIAPNLVYPGQGTGYMLVASFIISDGGLLRMLHQLTSIDGTRNLRATKLPPPSPRAMPTGHSSFCAHHSLLHPHPPLTPPSRPSRDRADIGVLYIFIFMDWLVSVISLFPPFCLSQFWQGRTKTDQMPGLGPMGLVWQFMAPILKPYSPEIGPQ